MVSVVCNKNSLIVPGNQCSFPKALPCPFCIPFPRRVGVVIPILGQEIQSLVWLWDPKLSSSWWQQQGQAMPLPQLLGHSTESLLLVPGDPAGLLQATDLAITAEEAY